MPHVCQLRIMCPTLISRRCLEKLLVALTVATVEMLRWRAVAVQPGDQFAPFSMCALLARHVLSVISKLHARPFSRAKGFTSLKLAR